MGRSLAVTILGAPVSKKNFKQIYINRTSGRPFIASNARVKEWEQAALWQLKSVKAPDWLYPLRAEYKFYFDSNRRRDLSNCVEAVNDCLVKAGILQDDSTAHLRLLVLEDGGLDKASPRTEVILSEITGR